MIKIILPRYLDLLDQERQKVFYQLKKFKKDFVLAGGTAIMLQIGYRLSYDFDLFTNKPLTDDLLKKIKKVFGRVRIDLFSEEIVLIKNKDNIDIHFVSHPYKEIKSSIKTSVINISHLDDLAANKAYTLGRRPAWRDYVDIFFLLKWRHFNLQQIIEFAKKKFNFEFNEKLFLEQLTYYEDVKVAETIFLKEKYSPVEIKSFLEKEVKKYLQKVLR